MIKNRIARVGLTGCMGCGKSEVRRLLAKRGVPTVDADSLAKEIAVTDPAAMEAIRARFGSDIYDRDGTLRREILAARVFGNAAEVAALNRILHPRVRARVEAHITALSPTAADFVIIEAALLFEAGWDREMDVMVVVAAPLEKRTRWLALRDGMTPEQMHARLQHQWPLEEKIARADYIVENNGTLAALEAKVVALHEWLRNRFLKEPTT